MAIYKVINEENETLNESGGAHQKFVKLRSKKVDEANKKINKLEELKSKSSGKLADALENDIRKQKKDRNFYDTDKASGFYGTSGLHQAIKDSRKNSSGSSRTPASDSEVRLLKSELGVGKRNAERNERKPGLYKQYQDIRKNETFDMCADYVVGCLEGSVDEFDLDLFTEASAFIIDCLDEDDE